jgi:hypothetical protein
MSSCATRSSGAWLIQAVGSCVMGSCVPLRDGIHAAEVALLRWVPSSARRWAGLSTAGLVFCDMFWVGPNGEGSASTASLALGSVTFGWCGI